MAKPTIAGQAGQKNSKARRRGLTREQSPSCVLERDQEWHSSAMLTSGACHRFAALLDLCHFLFSVTEADQPVSKLAPQTNRIVLSSNVGA